MDSFSLNSIPWELVISSGDWGRLLSHHFRGDADEHAAVLLCGVVETPRVRRLLVREVVLAEDGKDYVAGTHGYRALAPAFVMAMISRAAAENLAYVAVHNHLADEHVEFSGIDLASQERGYRALLDINNGGPVGWMVLGARSAAGRIRTRTEHRQLARTIVLGGARQVVRSSPAASATTDPRHDRQIRLFGDAGQAILSQLKVGVVGAGGAGSLIIQALAHLGVGQLVVADHEVLELTNQPRVVGSRPMDAHAPGACGWRGTSKAEIARRHALLANPVLRFHAVEADVEQAVAADALVDCDAIFLAADTMRARHVVNAIAHQYLIPTFQVGAKARPNAAGHIVDAFAVARMVGVEATCMWCSELIDPTRLQLELLSDEDRQAAEYAPGIAQPSVITMNSMSSAFALNDFLFMFTGLHAGLAALGPSRYHFLTREFVREVLPSPKATCLECGPRKGRGARGDLPLRRR